MRAFVDKERGRRQSGSRGGLLAGLVCLWLAGGCQPDISPPATTDGLQDLQPTFGSVRYHGQPTPGAVVMFFPDNKSEQAVPRMAGTVDAEGDFEMQTTVAAGSRPGIRPGKYIVTVTWNEKVDPADKDSDDGPDLVPSHYGDPQSSPLRITIEEGENDLDPFELRDPDTSSG